jgi:chloramphenicol O-acetyltransferase
MKVLHQKPTYARLTLFRHDQLGLSRNGKQNYWVNSQNIRATSADYSFGFFFSFFCLLCPYQVEPQFHRFLRSYFTPVFDMKSTCVGVRKDFRSSSIYLFSFLPLISFVLYHHAQHPLGPLHVLR